MHVTENSTKLIILFITSSESFNSVFEIKLQSHFDLCPPKSKYMISALLNILNINNLLISKNNLVVFRLKRIYDWQSDLK